VVGSSAAWRKTGGRLAFKPLKTRHGRSSVSLSALMVEIPCVASPPAARELNETRVVRAEQRLESALNSTIWCSPYTVVRPGHPTASCPGHVLRACGAVPPPPLIAASVEVLTVSRRLGHGAPAITRVVSADRIFGSTGISAAMAIALATDVKQ
jgi:hypothetical protein